MVFVSLPFVLTGSGSDGQDKKDKKKKKKKKKNKGKKNKGGDAATIDLGSSLDPLVLGDLAAPVSTLCMPLCLCAVLTLVPKLTLGVHCHSHE